MCSLITPCVYATDAAFSRGSFCDKVVQVVGLKSDILSVENYTDVNENDEYYNSIMIMSELKYMNGYEDGTFRPTNMITNGEVAKVLSTVLFGYNFTVPEDVDCYELYGNHWASKYIWKIETSGIMHNVLDWSDYCCENNINYSLIEELASQGITHTYGGTCGNDLTWELTHTGTLTIAGKGKMHTYSKSNKTPWYPYIENINKVVVLDNVTSIGDYAFQDCSNLVDVELSENLTIIGKQAFYRCSNINNLTIPDSVLSIGDSAFEHCSGIQELSIGNSVTDIGKFAFADCSNIKTLNLPDSIKNIGMGGFARCSNISNLFIGNGTESIGYHAFGDCSSVVKINIPSNVANIGDTAFYRCSSLTEIDVDENNKYYSDVDGVLFNKSKTSLILYPMSKSGVSFDIPDGVIKIEEDAFFECVNLKQIKLPNTLVDIESSAFYGCSGLLEISIPNSVANIGEIAFHGCANLKTVTLSTGLTSLNRSVFTNCISLQEITIPDNVTQIGDSVFSGCTNLTNIRIGPNVNSIGDSPFSDCYNLRNIYVDKNNNYYSDNNGILFDKKKTKIINYPAGKADTSYNLPNSVIIIGNYTFEGCRNLTEIKLGDNITEIGYYAFSECIGLKSIDIPDSTTTIGNYAFYKCTNLSSVKLPRELEQINHATFANCRSLVEIYIPQNVSIIESSAFSGCRNLNRIMIPKSITEIYGYAFKGCYSLTDVFYGGTSETYSEISIGSDNTYFNDAVVHYNSQPFSEIGLSLDRKTFTITPRFVNNGNIVILALYRNNAFVKMYSVPYSGTSVIFTVSENYDKAKVMVWENFSTLVPITIAEEIK